MCFMRFFLFPYLFWRHAAYGTEGMERLVLREDAAGALEGERERMDARRGGGSSER